MYVDYVSILFYFVTVVLCNADDNHVKWKYTFDR